MGVPDHRRWFSPEFREEAPHWVLFAGRRDGYAPAVDSGMAGGSGGAGRGGRSAQGMMARSVRVGLLMAGVPGIPWAAITLAVAVVELFRGAGPQLAVRDMRYCGLLFGGSLLAGVLMGLILAGGLVVASHLVTRAWGLAVVGALVGTVVFPAELVVVAIGTDGAYLEIGTTLLAWPAMAAVAGAHSADVVGRTRTHAWLWAPGFAQRLRRGSQACKHGVFGRITLS